MTTAVVPRDESAAAVRRRGDGLTAAVIRVSVRMGRWAAVGYGIAIGATLASTVMFRSPVAGVATGVAIALVVLVVAWWPLLDPDVRGAIELMADHNCHETAEWRAETGTRVPVGIAAMDKWLAAHPTGAGRASILLRLGRLAAAEEAIEEMEPKTPEEAFGVEILRLSSTLLAGHRPNLAPLQSSWRSLPDPRERRHRRECLALLEAQVRVADRLDPIPTLAVARREIAEVHPSMRITRLVAKWLVAGLIVIAIAAGLGAVVS